MGAQRSRDQQRCDDQQYCREHSPDVDAQHLTPV
jgi:hypothetical protein